MNNKFCANRLTHFILFLTLASGAHSLAQPLTWFSAQESHVESAICRREGPKNHSEVMRYFADLDSTSPLQSKDLNDVRVRGVLFQNERPSLVLAFAELTSFTEITEEGRLNKTISEKPLNVPQSCTKVLCAVEHIFGEKVGPMILFLMHKYSLNAAPEAFDKAGTWSESELSRVLKALTLVPEHLTSSFRLNQQLSRIQGGHPGGQTTVLADARMRFYNPWSRQSERTQELVVLHEFAHVFANTISTYHGEFFSHDQGNIWNGLFGQNLTASFVSQYSQKNTLEDFAESFVAYRLNPDLLIQSSPEKYAYLKKYIFAGAEYTSPEKCQNTKISLQEPSLSGPSKEEIFNSCKVFVGRHLRHVNSFKNCINHRALRLHYIEQGYEPGFFPAYIVDRQIWAGKMKFPKLAKELAERHKAELYIRHQSSEIDAEYQRFIDAL